MTVKNLHKIIIAILLLFSAGYFYAQNNTTTSSTEKGLSTQHNKDSVNLLEEGTRGLQDSVKKGKLLQDRINNIEIKIDDYYKHLQQIKNSNKNIAKEKKKLKVCQKKIESYQKKKRSLENKILQANDNLAVSQKETPILRNKFSADLKKINKKLSSTTGELEFSYKKNNYLAFIADIKIHKIRMHLNYRNSKDKNAQKFIMLSSLKKYLESRGNRVLMLTNGGMYTPRNDPEGLLIADTVEIAPIDLGESQRMLNFYLKPNGVFYIQDGKAYIEETNEFNTKYTAKKINPEQATQSGPMLLINGDHHPALNHNSSSDKLRSGVGIMENGKVIFIISNSSITNFHDFSTIFKELFGCENALFLDGTISKMYMKDKNPNELDGNFGPIISITKK